MSEQVLVCYCIVRNIPSTFHSLDLRTFFSQLTEEEGFSCFHFKHRPEVIRSFDGKSTNSKKTLVCVVKFGDGTARQRCIDMYHDKNWINRNGDYLKEKCKIVKFFISNEADASPERQQFYQTQKEKNHRRRHADNELFSEYNLLNMSELNPPKNVMPNGNVGTPTSVFQDLIRQCALPSSLIKSLGLKFSNSGSSRRYGNVPFTYEGSEVVGKDDKGPTSAHTAHGRMVVDMKDTDEADEVEKETQTSTEEATQLEDEPDTVDSDLDDVTGEEWERHAAFHDDVTSQERSKERLFEEKIELKWEKGGSGLVFYTDAQYWAEEEGGFDEQTTDDWDVDMSVYYGEDGDKDAKDFVQIQKEKRLRSGLDVDGLIKKQTKKIGLVKQKVGNFEKHTRGFGRKIMEKLGWDDHRSLGPGNKGLLEALEAEGQSSRVKMGFGYHGEKLARGAYASGNYKVTSQKQDGDSDMASTSKDTPIAPRPIKSDFRRPHTPSQTSQFPLHRSVEPHASHSWIFPQFRTNLVSVYDNHIPMAPRQRAKIVPGEEGVAITTVFDEPLDIDTDPGLVRSQPPTALKRRLPSNNETKRPTPPPAFVPVTTGSKLVKRTKQQPGEDDTRASSSFRNTSVASSSYIPAINFVRPCDPSEHFV